MPENRSENAIIPDGEIAPETAKEETAAEKFERERLSRRQALKKFGMTSAMATFALFSVDDLARMVGKAMQQRAGDDKVAEQVAKEFQQAGIALAYNPSGPCGGCVSGGTCVPPPPGSFQHCEKCCDGCTCEHVVDTPCGPNTMTYAQCQACCKSRNPGSGLAAIAGYGNCVTVGGCI